MLLMFLRNDSLFIHELFVGSTVLDEKSGLLLYKAVMLGMTYWKQGYFVIR